jgi:hypothetical protein
MLSRLTDDWQAAQPAHLRHLGIIRDTGTQARFTYYKYRTYDGFQQAVDNGESKWEIVRSTNRNVTPPHPVLDNWGFPPVPSALLIRDGRATLADCVTQAKITPAAMTSYDPVIVRNGEDGVVSVAWPKRMSKTKNPKTVALAKEIMEGTPSRGRGPNPKQGPLVHQVDTKEKMRLYNANYRAQKKLEAELAERENQIRYRAEKMAYNESLAKQMANGTVHSIPESTTRSKSSTVFKPKPSQPKVFIVDNLPKEMALPPKTQRGRPKKAKENSDRTEASKIRDIACKEVENNSTSTTKQGKHCICILECRIQELVTLLRDTSRQAVHVNPPGSKPVRPLIRGRKQAPQLLVVFKFSWLHNLDWFVALPPPSLVVIPELEDAVVEIVPQIAPAFLSHALEAADSEIEDEPIIRSESKRRSRKRTLNTPPMPSPKRARMDCNGANFPPVSIIQPNDQPNERIEEDVHMGDIPSEGELPDARENSDPEYNEQSEVVKHSFIEKDTAEKEDNWNLRNSNYKKPELPPHRSFRKKRGTGLGGGSVQFKRTLLILEIIEKCGGVFPGDGEIVTVYQRFQKEANSSKTDRDTILKAVKSCVDTGKLKKVAYVIADKGLAVTRSILLLPDIAIGSPIAQALIKNVEAVYPKIFHPAEVAVVPRKQPKNISRFLHQETDFSASLQGTGWAENFRNKQKELEARREADLDTNRKQRIKYHMARGRFGEDGSSQKLVSLKRRTREQCEALERQLPDHQFPSWSEWNDNQGQDARERDHSDEPTMAELLSNLGSFAPTFEHEDDYDGWERDEDVDEVLPSIETDVPRIPRRGRVWNQPDSDDSWIIEDPASMHDKRFTPARRSSVYSISDTETDVEHERRIRSESADNAFRSRQHIINLEDPSDWSSNHDAYLDGRPQTHPDSLAGLLQSAFYQRSSVPHLEESSAQERFQKKRSFRPRLVHDQLKFKPTGPQDYNPGYDWEDVTTILDPDQRFHASTGTFSTDFYVRKNIRTSKWIQPSAPLMFENMSSTDKRDIDILLEIDDWDIHYHPDRPKKWFRASHYLHDISSDDDYEHDEYDEIECTKAERKEIKIMRKTYPGMAMDRNQGGFVNYGLGHEQEGASQVRGVYGYRPGDRIMVYRTSNQFLPTHIRSAPFLQPRDIRTGSGSYGYVRTVGGGIQGFQQRGPQNYSVDPAFATSLPRSEKRVAKPVRQDPNCVITPDAARRLLFAVIAVRALAGGLDSAIKWPYIHTVFANYPHYDVVTFKSRWQRMQNNNKELVARLTRDFQDSFILAYSRDEVPKFNANDSRNYDWNAVVDWAVRNITVFPEEIVLPPDRKALDRNFHIDTTIRTKNDEIKAKTEHLLSTNTQRMNETHNLDVYVPLVLRPRHKPNKWAGELAVARSWTRACSATDFTFFNSQAADAKMRVLDDKLVAECIRQLHDEKVIAHSFKGKHKPGRNFHLGSGYRELFAKRPLELQHFYEAMAFKKYLDTAAATEGEPLIVKYDASDGQYLAIIELMANGRIKVVPQLPPMNSNIGDPWPRLSVWGFMEGHYRGRDTDKKVFIWDVAVVKTDKYTAGFPFDQIIKEVPPPTSPGSDKVGKERIPIWRDIHGNLRKTQWRRLLYCVMQYVAIRAGSGIDALRAQFKGLIWDWEIELLVEWLVTIGVARWTSSLAESGAGKGVMAKEWWWTVIPEGGLEADAEADGHIETDAENGAATVVYTVGNNSVQIIEERNGQIRT